MCISLNHSEKLHLKIAHLSFIVICHPLQAIRKDFILIRSILIRSKICHGFLLSLCSRTVCITRDLGVVALPSTVGIDGQKLIRASVSLFYSHAVFK